jgi:AcrR family transcriptional regulator
MTSVGGKPRPVKDQPERHERHEPHGSTPRPSLLPPATEAQGTVRELLEVAVAEFARLGYHGVSVRDITDRVGIRPASLYAHFASKEALLLELMRLGHRNLLDLADRTVAALGDDASATERLAAHVRSYVGAHAAYPELSRVCTNELRGLGDDSLTEILALRMESIGQVVGVLRQGSDAGEFTVDDVFLTAMAIFGMVIRIANWYSGNQADLEFGPVLDSDRTPSALYSVDRVAEAYAEMALRLVGAR